MKTRTQFAKPNPTVALPSQTAIHLAHRPKQPLHWFSLFVVLLLPLAASGQCTTVTNLTAWWPGDGHSYDVVNVRLAALQNGATYAAGNVGGAFSFAGTNDKVRIGEALRTDLSRTNTWTIEAWVKPASFTNAAFPTIYSEGNKVASLGLNNGTGQLESWINNASANRIIGTNSLTLNAWNHVALVRDGANRSLYVNGTLAGATNVTPATTADSSGSAIGNVTVTDPTSAFEGQVDEVSLYFRALSAGEIAAINAAGAAGKCYTNTPAPVFVIQPADQNNYLGATATFTGLAMGSPRPTYQWSFNGTNQLAGQTNYTLVLTNLTFAQDGNYTLVATSSSGVTTSAVARLAVRFCNDTPVGLVAWWPGDGSGLDVTGNHHGSVWGNVTYPAGIVAKAFGFNGTDAYVSVPDSSALSPHVGTNGEMSVEAWVNLAQLPQTDPYTGGNRRTVLAKGDSGRWEYELSITTAGVPEFYVYSAAGAPYVGAVGGQIILNQWHHLVGTIKKGQFIRLYQDGALMNESTTIGGDTIDGATPLYIGRRSDGQFLNSRVDEVAIYNRALDTNEITTLFAGGAFGKCDGAANPAPFFAVQPASQSGYQFLNAGLAGLALGTPRPDYQWYRSNSPTIWTNIAGATNATLAFNGLTGSEEGFYRVTASNQYGVVTSQPAWLEVACHPIVCSTNGEDFESGWNGWTSDSGFWQIGVGGGRSGSGVCTVLGGNAPDNANTRLISPPFTVPSTNDNPRLQFSHYFSTVEPADYCFVEIRTVGGSWTTISPSYYYYSGVWTPARIDLKAYAGQQVQIAFRYISDSNSQSDGWYVDDVKVVTGPIIHNDPETFAGGWGDWHAERGIWQISNGYAETGAGNSPDHADSRLISPPFTVPAANENPRLQFSHYFSTVEPADYCFVEIRTVGGSWTTISPSYYYYSGVWTPARIDLKAYAGQQVQIAFRYISDSNSQSDGWYVDDVKVVTGPIIHNDPETFAGGWGDWHAERGIWEIGNGYAATVLGGNAPDHADSRLISPPFTVPPTNANPRLQFRHNYNTVEPGDYGFVQIRPIGGGWTTISPSYFYSSGGWAAAGSISLNSYAGQHVQIAFSYISDSNSQSDGWYVDDVFVKLGSLEIAPITDKSISETNCLTFPVSVIGADGNSILSFSLGAGAPAGATIDPSTGDFTWCPTECQSPGTYRIPIYVVDFGNNEANDLGFVNVTVNEINQPPWLLPAEVTAYVGKTNWFTLCSGDADCPANPLTYSLLGTVPTGLTIDASSGVIRWVPTAAQDGSSTVQVRLCDGGSPNLCVTNLVSVGVTTNAPYSFQVDRVANGDLQFTIFDGMTNVSYMLQQTTDLCDCSCESVWQSVGIMSPTEMPATFLYAQTNFGTAPKLFFRLDQVPRSP